MIITFKLHICYFVYKYKHNYVHVNLKNDLICFAVSHRDMQSHASSNQFTHAKYDIPTWTISDYIKVRFYIFQTLSSQ
jgi:hypothetical protein